MTNEPMIQLEAKDGHDAPWVPVGEPFPAPVSNEHLDRAINSAQERVYNNQERVVDPLDRTYARVLIAELLCDMDEDDADPCCQWSIGWGQALAEIKRRAGIEEAV